MFVDIANSFIEYINSLDKYEIEQLDDDIKASRYGIKSILEIESTNELLKIFELFHYLNRRLLLTNDLMIIPYGEVPEGTEKINLKLLYEMFKDTELHGLVSIQFLCVLGKFFEADFSILKQTITELYMNLSYETLSKVMQLLILQQNCILQLKRVRLKI